LLSLFTDEDAIGKSLRAYEGLALNAEITRAASQLYCFTAMAITPMQSKRR
jgi:hypothetical protein